MLVFLFKQLRQLDSFFQLEEKMLIDGSQEKQSVLDHISTCKVEGMPCQ